MSEHISNIEVHKPDLKRSQFQKRSSLSDPFQFKSSVSLSRHTGNLLSTASQSTSCESQKAEDMSITNANVELINRKIVQEIDQQFTSSIRAKSKKSFYHSYEEKDDLGSIWLSQPKWIPRQVQNYYQQEMANADSEKKVNFLQGFLSEIGFMYYMVERNIYFYDIETMNEDSVCQNVIQVEKKLVNACYGMQVMTLGQPYITRQRRVLVILQIYQAEFYHFQILKDTPEKGRKIQLKSLNLRFSISNIKPSNLVISRRGYLYYVDDKGGLQQIECNHSTLANNISQLVASSKRFTQEFKDFWVKMARNVSQNIRSYTKVVVNLGKSMFRSFVPESFLVYDSKRNLLMVYQKIKENKYEDQSIKVYDQTSGRLLYTISKEQMMQKSCARDTIINLCILQEKLNSDYNMVAILNSGKRIFFDITNEALRKSVVYQASTPENKPHLQYSHNVLTIESSVLQQTYLAQLMSTSSNFYFHFIRQEMNSRYEVVYKLDVETHGGPRENDYYIFNRQLQELGCQKQCLLALKNLISAKDMNQEVRQVFYRPQEIIHSSDKLSQRIVVLRPVDVFFGIVYSFQNTTVVAKALSIALPFVKKQQLLSFASQILLDQEGIYYISRKQIAILKAKMSIRLQQYEKRDTRNNLQTIQFKEISHNVNKIKDRLQSYMLETINDEYGLSDEEKDSTMARGIIKYLSKIIRCVWFTNLNDLDRNTCRLVISLLDRYQVQIGKLRLSLRINNQGTLSHLLSWCQKLKQLMFLTLTITKLPSKILHEAVSLEPEQFHEYIFDFLTKFCKQQIPVQLKEKVYIYVNESFTKTFRFWQSFKELKTVEQRLKLCRQKSELIPQYLIRIISKQKGFSDIKIQLKRPKLTSSNIQQHFKNVTSFKQILKYVAQAQSGLIEKELLLKKAEEKLQEESKYNEVQLSEGMVEINDLRSQIKLQKLIKAFYTSTTSQEGWKSRLSRKFNLQDTKEKSQKEKLTNLLDKCLLDSESLSQLVAQSKDDYLEIVFASLFLTEQLIAKIQALIDKTVNGCRTVRQLPALFKSQFRYFLETANIEIDQQVFVKLYIEKMAQLPQMIEIMRSEEGILEEDLYFPLSFAAELKGQPERWFKWGKDRALRLDRNSAYFLYLCACTTYLVRNFLKSKNEQWEMSLLRGGTNEAVLKKLVVFLVDRNTL